jgi:hypothetical protein
MFKGNNPSNFFLLFLLGLLLYWPAFFHVQTPIPSANQTLLYQKILDGLNWIFGGNAVGFSVMIFFMILMQSFVLNEISISQRLFQRQNFLVGMSYWFFSAAVFLGQPFGPVNLVVALLVWIMYQINMFQTTQTPGRTLYNTGLLLGTALLIDHTAFVFIFLPMIGLTIMRPFRLQEWFIALLGVLTPIYIQLGSLFVLQGNLGQSRLDLKFEMPVWNLFPIENLHLAVILLVVLTGFLRVHSNRMKELVQARNSWSVILATAFLSLTFLFFDGEQTRNALAMLMPTIAFFGAATFYYTEMGWFRTLMYLALLGMAFAQGFFFVFR